MILAEENTKIRNNEDLRQELLNMAAHPDWFDPRYLGHGPLTVGNYIARTPLDADKVIVEAEA